MTPISAMFRSLALALSAGLALMLAAAPAPALAGVDVDINQGNIQPAPIAIPAFGGADPKSQDLGADIARVISGNLERSGYFRPLDPAAMVEKSLDINVLPRFADWK